MRRIPFFAFMVLLVTAPTLAQDADSIVYLPAKDGQPAQTVKLPGGKAQAVIESQGINRPETCPNEAFWSYGPATGELIDCANNSVWEIKPYEDANNTTYMFRLAPSSKPKPGTDDPGSSKSKSVPGSEVNP